MLATFMMLAVECLHLREELWLERATEAMSAAIAVLNRHPASMAAFGPAVVFEAGRERCGLCTQYVGEEAGPEAPSLVCYRLMTLQPVRTPGVSRIFRDERVMCYAEATPSAEAERLEALFYAATVGDPRQQERFGGVRDALGQGPLHWAARNRFLWPKRLVALALRGADLGARDREGKTFLDVLRETRETLEAEIGGRERKR